MLKTVRLCQRPVEFQRSRIFLVERQERNCPVFLVGQQLQHPATRLPVRNKTQLC